MRVMLKSKIHRAHVTETNLNYEGSITIDRTLMQAADILQYEQVDVVNVTNGARFTTYAIEGKANCGGVCLNGAAARLVACGDIVIILSYSHMEDSQAKSYHPRIVHVSTSNTITEVKDKVEPGMLYK